VTQKLRFETLTRHGSNSNGHGFKLDSSDSASGNPLIEAIKVATIKVEVIKARYFDPEIASHDCL
jgi:hypothetical protein